MKSFTRVMFRGVVVLSTLLFGVAGAYAQFNLGTITGRVTDPAGAVTPQCKIEVQEIDTGATRSTIANNDGVYTLPSLPAGNYKVSASLHGFKQETATILLGVNQTLTLDFQLTLGAVTETVTVDASGGAVALQQEDHTISQSLEQTQINSLPVEGRNFLSLAVTVPGVQSATLLRGGGSGGYFETLPDDLIVSGTQPGGTAYLLDGVPNINLLTQAANIIPDMDAIQEVNIETNGMSAKFDRPAIVNVLTKSGGNRFHGSLYDFLQNDALDGNNWVSNLEGIPKGPHRYNQFGGTIGGPIQKDKLFFFFNYEGQRQTDAVPDTERVPTDAERGGDYSAWLTGVTVGLNTTQTVTLYDPSTYVPNPSNPSMGTIQSFPGNIIPTDRISPFATEYLSFFPHPNVCPSSPCNTIEPGGYNFVTNLDNTSNADQYLGRVDYNISQKDRLFGYYQYTNAPQIDPSYIPNLFGDVLIRRGTNVAVEETHVFSPTLLNTVRFGYNRSIYYRTQLGVGSKDWVSLFGIQNLDPTIAQNSPPSVSVSGVGSLGNQFAPQGDNQNRFQYADEMNYTHGKHQIDAGVEVVQTQFDGNWVLRNSGFFDFNGEFTSNHNATAFSNGLGSADFLLGIPDEASGGNGTTVAEFRKWDFVGYAQDDFRVRHDLVLNLGVRYLYDGAPVDKGGHAAVFNIPTNTSIPGTWNSNPHDFAPRIGFAWTLGKKTVVRGGYGFYYFIIPYNALQFLMANPPNFLSVDNDYTYYQPNPVAGQFPAFQPGSTIFAPFAVNKSMPTPYTEQYNLNIQRELSKNMLFSIAYVGNQAHDGAMRLNANQAMPVTDPNNPTPLASRRPYPNIGDISAQFNVNSSNYNALQAKLQKNFSGGLSFLASYTWSRAFDISDNDDEQVNNIYDWRGSYGAAGYDQPQIFSASYVYQLPFGHGRRFLNTPSRVLDGFLGGWQLNGITGYSSGQPFWIGAPDMADVGSRGGIAYADQLCSGRLPSSQQNYFHWFNTACYASPAPYTIGDAHKNILRGEAFHDWDLSLFKTFRLWDTGSLQFRAEAFNAFNEHSLESSESVTTTDSNFGGLSSATAARTMQIALKFLF